MDPVIDVRLFAAPEDYAAMIDYFHGATDELLAGMGVERAKMPSREEWLRRTLADHARPDAEKERFYLAWLRGGDVVGHSSLSHIVYGETGHCHMHLWRPELRGAGLGPAFLERSIDLYFERFALRMVACEPYAENPGPNRVLPRLGFQQVERLRTVPSGIAFVQDVNRWELPREAWRARRAAAGAPRVEARDDGRPA